MKKTTIIMMGVAIIVVLGTYLFCISGLVADKKHSTTSGGQDL